MPTRPYRYNAERQVDLDLAILLFFFIFPYVYNSPYIMDTFPIVKRKDE